MKKLSFDRMEMLAKHETRVRRNLASYIVTGKRIPPQWLLRCSADGKWFSDRIMRLADGLINPKEFDDSGTALCETWIRESGFSPASAKYDADIQVAIASPDGAVFHLSRPWMLKCFFRMQSALNADAYDIMYLDEEEVRRFEFVPDCPTVIESAVVPVIIDDLAEIGRDCDIVFRPISDRWHYVIITGMEKEDLTRMLSFGIPPAYIQKTGNSSHEAIVKIPADREERINGEISKTLGFMFGGNMRDSEHAFFPSFVNGHNSGKTETFLVTTPIYSGGEAARDLSAYGEWRRTAPVISELEREIKMLRAPITRIGDTEKPENDEKARSGNEPEQPGLFRLKDIPECDRKPTTIIFSKKNCALLKKLALHADINMSEYVNRMLENLESKTGMK